MRRGFAAALSTLFVLPLLAQPAPKAKPTLPNIVVFFMDDLGYSDLHIDGATDVKTPNLDRLARESVRLSNCYAAASVCTPTRAAFMTGRYQHRVGLESVLTPAHHDKGLSSAEPTLPRYLKDAGYATGLIGKWHLGWKPEFRPNAHGFDEFFGFLGGAVSYYSHHGEGGERDLYENDKLVELKTYLTDEIATRAVSFVERHAGGPFFLDVAFNATHWPFEPPGLASTPATPTGTPFEIVEQWAAEGNREDYVRMLERADAAIGRILSTIEEFGLRDNTLVIFTNDNGGEWLSRNEPLTNRKGTLWEGGLRVPCMFRWPGKLPQGKVSSQAAITMDLTATILAAANAKVSQDRPLEGIDLLPILMGRSRQIDRTFFWLSPFPGNMDHAMRSGKWKYLGEHVLFPGLLFDLDSDPSERHDLAAKHPELIRKMKAQHRAWVSEVRPKAPPATQKKD